MNIEAMRCRVTAADLVRRFGQWQEQAMIRPVYITHHGRDRLVLTSVAAYAAISARARADAGIGAAVGEEGLLEQLAEGFIAFDASLRVTAINPVAAAYCKLVRSETIGIRLFERAEALHRSLLYTHLVRGAQSGEIGAFDMPSVVFEGRWLHVRTFPHADGVACLMRDITEEVANRRLADGKAATIAAMAAHGRIGRAKLSPRGTFVEVDAAVSDMAGFEADALMRARLTDVLPLNRRVSAARELELVLTGGTPRAFDTLLLRANGEELPVRISLAELRGDYACDGAVAIIAAQGVVGAAATTAAMQTA